MNHLFLFTIGPVQSFIAQARKTQDLYAGSQLLSVLTDTAMNKIGKENVIFPNSDIESKPNRFVAKIAEPEKGLEQLGKEVEKAVRQEWEWIAMKTPGDYNLSIPPGFQEQIQQHLKIHWVFHPIESDYKTAFQQLEGLLAAVKQTNDFEQFPEVGRKCSVDGQLNVKFYSLLDGEPVNKAQYKLYNKDNYIVDNKKTSFAILQPGEGLSAVSFVKRAYRKDDKPEEFKSTADIALLKAISYWESTDSLYEDYKQEFNGNFNAQFLYEDNLTARQLEKQGLKEDHINKLPELRRQQQTLQAKAKSASIHLCKYYALLLFDGDGMGKLLGGDHLKTDKKLEDFHKTFSEKLGDFAEVAKDYLDENSRGRTVYAGGDDFMGFVNLESLFEVIICLQRKFRNLVSFPLQQEGYLQSGKEITFSAGICIAHYKEPLSLVLKRLRELEKKAKDFRPEKNAFAIGVIKGSGEDHQTAWGLEHWSAARKLVQKLRSKHFSNTFIKNFQRTFALLQDLDEPVPQDLQPMYCTELLRLTERSANRLKFSKAERKAEAKKLVVQLRDKIDFNSKNATLKNLFELLNICDFLHRTLNPDYAEQRDEQPTA